MSIRLAVVALVVLALDARADPPREGLAAPFAAMEKGLRQPDEALFRAQWHPEGYTANLVGGSGIAGENVFRQGSRKEWYPKPDLAQATVRPDGAVAIVPCQIFSWKKNKPVDAVDFVLVRVGAGYVVLGGGEKRAEVDALAQRWLDKKPLAPK